MERVSSHEPCGVGASCRLASMLHAQVRRNPERVAVVQGNQVVTYGELWERAVAVAAGLHAAGVGPGTHVGLATGRGPDLLVALWGIVLSGAAYVPLDPSYPQARIQQMVTSARLGLIVTTAAHAPVFGGAGLVVIEDLEVRPGALAPRVDVTSNDPLYAIFTSGSTGQPKAASVFRRGFANLLEWYVREFGIGAGDRFLVITSPSFDLTQKNLFAPLVVGGSVIFDHAGHFDLPAVLGLIRERAVTVLNCTPSAFHPLVDAAAEGGYAALASLRLVVLGGEPIQLRRLRPWLGRPDCRATVANTYGPTECTDICTFHRLDRSNLDQHSFVPLGREIDGVQVAILDDRLRPVTDGETGELCIGGAGVGGGYLHDSARTASSFVPNPAPDLLEGGRIYRTGDLARRTREGLLEFMGRADHQVKIRGFRIELGEIECVLTSHPRVRAAVAGSLDNGGAGPRLVAWVEVVEARDAPDGGELRSYLASRLPGHMVPDTVFVLPVFPLTPNGKVDRLSLMERCGETRVRHLSSPDANSAERKVLGIWSSVLGAEVDDAAANFFDLGANSIHLAIAHARLREEFQTDFPITILFARTTARTLAEFLSPQGAACEVTPSAKDRARLQQQALTRFRRPVMR